MKYLIIGIINMLKLFCKHNWKVKGVERGSSLLFGKVWREVFECKKCEKVKKV